MGYSVLDAHVIVRGDIETDGTLRVDGRLEGNVLRASAVVVGTGGSIAGDIHATELVVGGTIHGSVIVERRVELEATAVVVGDIEADAILIHEGGRVRGRVMIRTSDDARADAPQRLRLPSPATADA